VTARPDVVIRASAETGEGPVWDDRTGELAWWAGSVARTFEPGRGKLHCWVHGQPSRVVAGGFTLPNGMGWNGASTGCSWHDDVCYVRA
jgi:hypothetical protein